MRYVVQPRSRLTNPRRFAPLQPPETAEQAMVRQEGSFWTQVAAAPAPPLTATDLERAYNRFVESSVPTHEQAMRLQELEYQMQQRNAERAQEQAYRDIMNYRTHLGVPDGSSRATTRSLKLLREHLSPEQLTAWDRDGYFAVKGNVSGAIYHLTMGGVQRTSDGHEFCLQLVGDEWTPLYDAVLARKILLECDETKFLGTANNLTTGNRRGQRLNEQIQRLQQNTGAMARLAAWMNQIGGTGAR